MRLIAAAHWLIAFAAPAYAQAPHWIPDAGTYPYRYETITNVPDAPGQRFRIDYDLVSDGKGGVVAVIRSAASAQGKAEWAEIEIEPDCRAAQKGQGTELARVTLWPLSPDLLTHLGTDFIDECAPTEIFFPLTDVLNLTLFQVAPSFRMAELAKPGDSRPTPGQKMEFERLDTALSVDALGGTMRLDTLEAGRATFAFLATPSKVRIIHRRAYSGADITLTGTERTDYRFVIDPRTGVLLSVDSTRSELDMTMTLPGDYSQPMMITREMHIAARP